MALEEKMERGKKSAREAYRILLVDDDIPLLKVLEHHLTHAGYRVEKESKPKEALARIQIQPPDILVTDLRMPGFTGHELHSFVRQHSPETLVIMLTGFPTVDDAVQAMREGAYDFIQKPVDREHLLSVMQKAAHLLDLREENVRLHNLVDDFLGFDNMVGQSPAMQAIYSQARQVAGSSANILLFGETGTGKDLLARAIHRAGPRSQGPFVAINCAAIPAELLESELFGHVKGSFTGAIADKKGKFQAAEGGTLFLDEIGDLPKALQPKLLRALQERVVEPVGSTKSIPVNFRLISATHRDLKKKVEEGSFREDLYYRLHVVPITLPPLRERREDISLLFTRFLKKECDLESRPPLAVDPELLECLERQLWPGNVRELENLARRLVALTPPGITVGIADLPAPYAQVPDSIITSIGAATELPSDGLDLEEWIDQLFLQALEKNDWNQSKTARYLHISRNTLIYRIEKRGLRRSHDVQPES